MEECQSPKLEDAGSTPAPPASDIEEMVSIQDVLNFLLEEESELLARLAEEGHITKPPSLMYRIKRRYWKMTHPIIQRVHDWTARHGAYCWDW